MKLLKRKLLAYAALLAFSQGLANCSHSASIDLSIPTPTVGPDVVKEENLSGQYLSACLSNPLGGMRTISLTINPKDVTLETQFFNGTTCATLDHKETLRGQLQDQGATGDVHLVKLFIPIDSNISTWRYYNMKFDPSLIDISEFAITASDLRNVKPTIELKRVGGAPPPPARPAGSTTLQSGLYTRASGRENACAQTVSSMAVNGVVSQIWVQYQSPCSGTDSFQCNAGVCTNNKARITFLSNISYRYDNLVDGWSAVFQ